MFSDSSRPSASGLDIVVNKHRMKVDPFVSSSQFLNSDEINHGRKEVNDGKSTLNGTLEQLAYYDSD